MKEVEEIMSSLILAASIFLSLGWNEVEAYHSYNETQYFIPDSVHNTSYKESTNQLLGLKQESRYWPEKATKHRYRLFPNHFGHFRHVVRPKSHTSGSVLPCKYSPCYQSLNKGENNILESPYKISSMETPEKNYENNVTIYTDKYKRKREEIKIYKFKNYSRKPTVFLLHKVDMNLAYDTVTKKPYHKKVVALKYIETDPKNKQDISKNELESNKYSYILNKDNGKLHAIYYNRDNSNKLYKPIKNRYADRMSEFVNLGDSHEDHLINTPDLIKSTEFSYKKLPSQTLDRNLERNFSYRFRLNNFPKQIKYLQHLIDRLDHKGLKSPFY